MKGNGKGNLKANIGGLCSNCANLKHCSYASKDNNTWFCEEYVCEQSDAAGPIAVSLIVLNATTVSRGLCANCDVQQGCTLPQPPGGVWFCGEYE